jgi:CheY-like chemotaxis protein
VATEGTAKTAPRDVGEVSETVHPKRQLCILAVDDDSLVLANVTAMLEDLGHQVIAVDGGAKALEAIDSRPDIELVISDQAMPVMTGIQLIEQIRARRPALPVILATGYAEMPQTAHVSIAHLAKPFTQRALAEALASTSAGSSTRT